MRIPFFPNAGDGTFCFQAALRMALAALMPEKEFSCEELTRISGKLPGKWTWPTSAMLWMIEQGFSIKLIEDFDYALFASKGEAYLLERFGEEVGRAQIENSDIEREIAVAKRFASVAPIEVRVPDADDLRRESEAGSVVVCNVNAMALHGQGGYSGHFVVICEVGKNSVTLHDPGLPPAPALEVSLDLFDRAWAYPSTRDRNLLAISLPSKTA